MNLSANLAKYWAKPALISLIGQDEYDYQQSPEYKQLIAETRAISDKSYADKRTKAYKYYEANKDRFRKAYNSRVSDLIGENEQ